MKNPLVSINCITYNHEKYISDAIESFISQKTDFDYEILIHDDASTDNTANIIREYEKKYPNIINAIYQTENQYSKGFRVTKFNYERAKGKYIALCEGDDYWIDPYKLQKQVNIMESHAEYSACVHAAHIVSPNKDRIGQVRPSDVSKEFTVAEVISGGGGLFPTNSILYRSQYDKLRPDFYYNAPIGDYPLIIYLSMVGTVYYLSDYMSCYRQGDIGSWTWQMENADIKKLENFVRRLIKMLDDVNTYSNYKYDTVIKEVKKSKEFQLLLAKNDLSTIKTQYKKLYKELYWITKFKLHLKNCSPQIYNYIKNVKDKLIKIF